MMEHFPEYLYPVFLVRCHLPQHLLLELQETENRNACQGNDDDRDVHKDESCPEFHSAE